MAHKQLQQYIIMKHNSFITIAIFSFWMAASAAMADTKPTVLVTIKPLAMLVQGVVGDELTVRQLLPGNISPHDYALKFSDVRAINEAALVVWVGPELESAFTKPLAGNRKAVLTLMSIPGITWPAVSQSVEEEHDEDHAGHDHHGHHAHARDPHLWLNPVNGQRAARAVAERLAELYPARRQIFETNLRRFVGEIEALDKQSRQTLKPLGDRGFVVTHDGYGHFVQHYGLKQLASAQVVAGRQQGAKHVAEMLALGGAVQCVFTEVQLNNKAAVQLAGKLGVETIELDPIGHDVPLSESSYLTFMENLVTAFTRGLAGGGE